MGDDRSSILEAVEPRLKALGLSGISTNQGLALAGLMKTGARYGVGMAKIWDGAHCLGFFDYITAWPLIIDRLERKPIQDLAA